MDQRPILILVGRQRPHHVLLLAYGLGIGVSYLGGWIPDFHAGPLGEPVVTAWMAGLTVSGVVGLAGAYWRGQIRTGLLLERSAMLIGAGAVFGLAYTISSVLPRGVFTVGFCAAWGIANLALAMQIGKDLRSLGRKKTDNAGGHRERGRASYRWPVRWRANGSYSSRRQPAQGSGRDDGDAERFDSEVGQGPSERC